MLEKTFDPAAVEGRLYEAWETSGAFKPGVNPDGEAYTIVIPPPNVTGSLHMGHALNNTLQDVLCRFERMRGKAVLWQPGTDHAGIATQMVVERQLNERQQKRTDFTRDEFVEKVWEWRHESGGQIINQLKRLGATCDWSRERFTMGDRGAPDDQMVRAVMKVFVQLYNDGLIYRDKRLVNWDPHFETAISDLEVNNEERPGHFWHFKYPLENGETYEFPIAFDEEGEPTEWETRDYISIATTRPETMLGDGAVAVHPDDKRYAPIVGKRCLLPLADRYIPIIADEYPDPDFGSGAVKITGAHDFNDYQVAKRNNIEMFELLDTKARMVHADHVPEKYRGLDRFDARKAVVEDIDARGLLIQVEDKKVNQPIGDRSNVVIEPMLTDQWYVNAEELAKKAIAAVETGKTKFVPENWTKTYYQWMRNIEPWCISRQLWWGHRIPAWYGPRWDKQAEAYIFDELIVAENEDDALAIARDKHPDARVEISKHDRPSVTTRRLEGVTPPPITSFKMVQDNDVLDTWFSSGLWPFSTLGWPDDTAELKKHYPNSALVTAFDIIFFWVARMMMQGIYVMDEIPFKDVYIHALVLDEKGQKMSKSKGNVIDPLGLIDKYGADALRFTLTAMAAQGRNIRLSEQRIEGYRNFTTKLWNSARFTEMNECKVDPAFDPARVKETQNQWIIHELRKTCAETTTALEEYRFNDAAGALYRFIWNIFCDWHLELAKPVLQGADSPAMTETRAATAWVLDQTLKLLHPFAPFMTEELWGVRAERPNHLIVEAWPTASDFPENEKAAAEMNAVIALISEIRSVRQTVDLPAGEKFPMLHIADDSALSGYIDTHSEVIARLGRLERIETITEAAAPQGVALVSGGATFILDVAGSVDLAVVKTRLEKEVAKAEKEIGVIDKKLGNKNFVDRAPADVVEEQKERRADYEERREKLVSALTRLQ